MTVTIDLSEDIEAGLSALAQAQGLTLPDYVRRILELQLPERTSSRTLSRHERASILSDVKHLPLSPPLSDESIDRQTMYGRLEP